MVSTIYITRHGYRSNWLTDVPIPPPPTGLSNDPVLADHGVDQAKELSVFLSGVDPKVQRIYSSPFYRCVQTAEPIAEKVRLKVNIENGIGEWYAPTRLEHLEPPSTRVLSDLFPGLINDNYQPLLMVTTKGETEDDVHGRCEKAVRMLVEQLSKEPEIQTILLVTHAAPKIALGRALVGDRTFDVRTGTCSVDKYVLALDKEGNPGKWVAEYIGKTDFLSQGEEMHWSFEHRFDTDRGIKTTVEPENTKTTVYVPLDFSQQYINKGGVDSAVNTSRQTSLQIVGLETDKPLFRVGDQVYQGSWQDMVGTELYTDPSTGEVIGKTQTRIQLEPGQLVEHGETESIQEMQKTGYWTTDKKQTLMDKVKEINSRKK